MRHGIPMAGNFLTQENVVLTGACEAIVVDVQCIFPALGPLSKCFHTKFVTTSPIARMPDSEFIRFSADNAGENAKAAAVKIGEATKEVATSPEMKAVGADIRQGAAEAGAAAKDAFATAGTELKQGAEKAGDKANEAAATADAKIDRAAADAKK